MAGRNPGKPDSLSPPAKLTAAGPVVKIQGLSKTYTVNEQEAGAKATIRGIFHRQKTEVPAVDDITFSMMPGEIVGFLGPNGAGKTIEIGKRISEVKQKLPNEGRPIAASQIYLEIIRELGQSWEIIQKLEENLGLSENSKFRQTVTDIKFRDAIDGVVDPIMVQAIANKTESPSRNHRGEDK